MKPSRLRKLGWVLVALLAALVGMVAVAWLNERRSSPTAAAVPVVSGPALPAGRVPMQLGLGHHAGLFLDPDGELWGWGMLSGIPPIGFSVTEGLSGPCTPTRLCSGTNWIRLSYGGNHALLLRDDHTLWGLGYNTMGELGSTPLRTFGLILISSDTQWTEIAAGQFHSAALRSDGSLWTWGSLSQAKAVNKPAGFVFPPPARLPGTNTWIAVGIAGEIGAAIAKDGSLWTWDSSAAIPTPSRIEPSRSWASLGPAQGILAAIDSEGRPAAAAFPGYRLRFVPTSDGSTLPPLEVAGDARFDRLFTSAQNLVARRTDGTWWGLGLNTSGTLGVGDRNRRATLTLLPWPRDVVSAAMSHSTFGVVLADGSIWTSGRDTGQSLVRRSGPARAVVDILSSIGAGLGVPGVRAPSDGVLHLHPTKFWTWPGREHSRPTPGALGPFIPLVTNTASPPL